MKGDDILHYVISDIHNDNERLQKLLKNIHFSERDHLFVLGDLFDRAEYNPDPLGVYFTILKLGKNCTVIRGNHDQWLASYIMNYYQAPEKARCKIEPYSYNAFELLKKRLTSVDMQELAKFIMDCPLQVEFSLNDEKYLFAHAMTSKPEIHMEDDYYLMGNADADKFMEEGVHGYISMCGHDNVGGNRIWKNVTGNVYMCDCGCGFRSGMLGCLCLETKEEIYV